jgi:hypothetical protein
VSHCTKKKCKGLFFESLSPQTISKLYECGAGVAHFMRSHHHHVGITTDKKLKTTTLEPNLDMTRDREERHTIHKPIFRVRRMYG